MKNQATKEQKALIATLRGLNVNDAEDLASGLKRKEVILLQTTKWDQIDGLGDDLPTVKQAKSHCGRVLDIKSNETNDKKSRQQRKQSAGKSVSTDPDFLADLVENPEFA